MRKHRHYTAQGFTLLELSVVLTIIALIAGAIFAGKTILRAAEMRSVAGEAQRYTQAITDFVDKYHALPGDFAGAETLWGTSTDGCPGGASYPTETCNGDGNGHITDQTAATYNEEFRAWQHLANAKLIDGSYTGVTSSNRPNDITPGVNIPASHMKGGGWALLYVNNDPSNINYLSTDPLPGHVLWFGGKSNSGNIIPLLRPSEALDMDKKYDDGRPNTGKILAIIAYGGGTACSSGSNYNIVTHEGQNSCALVFKTGF